MKTMRGCHELHLKRDAVLLKNYVLCLIHYLNAPAFKLGCNAQYEKVELELISDIEMQLFAEKSMREFFLHF